MKRIRYIVPLALALVLAGCATPHVEPGRVVTPLADQTQPQNPKDSAELATKSERVVEYVLPAGSTVNQRDTETGADVTFLLSEDVPVRTTHTDTVDSKIGAADMSVSHLMAKLKSFRWVQGVGIFVFLFGVASFAWPPLRMVVGSVTTSLVISAAGIGLVILPTIVVGNELLILGGCVGAAALYMFIHRYGKKSGEVETLKEWVDDNKNGRVDPGEMKEKK